jgi:hypothetical protein
VLHCTRLERLASDKHSSSICPFISYEELFRAFFISNNDGEIVKRCFVGATTFSITTLSRTTLSITIRKYDAQNNDTQHNDNLCLCWESFMLSVTNNTIILNVVMLNVVMLNVVAPFCDGLYSCFIAFDTISRFWSLWLGIP